MQFSDNVLEILENFSSINQSIVFNPGDVITTMSPMKSIIAKAKSNETFTKQFGIYELPRFLVQYKSLSEPSIQLEDKAVRIQGKDGFMYAPLCEPSLVITPPDKPLSISSPDVEFKLEADVLKALLKAISITSSPQVAFTGDGESLFVEGVDIKNSAAHRYRRKVGVTSHKFRMIFEAENLKVLPRNYDIQISAKGLSRWVAEDVEYFIAVEQSSTFES